MKDSRYKGGGGTVKDFLYIRMGKGKESGCKSEWEKGKYSE